MLKYCFLCIFLRYKVVFLYRFKKIITSLIILKTNCFGFNHVPWISCKHMMFPTSAYQEASLPRLPTLMPLLSFSWRNHEDSHWMSPTACSTWRKFQLMDHRQNLEAILSFISYLARSIQWGLDVSTVPVFSSERIQLYRKQVSPNSQGNLHLEESRPEID